MEEDGTEDQVLSWRRWLQTPTSKALVKGLLRLSA